MFLTKTGNSPSPLSPSFSLSPLTHKGMAEVRAVSGSRCKQVFVFTSAGKPIFHRYDGEDLDGTAFCALFLVLMQSAAFTPRRRDPVEGAATAAMETDKGSLRRLEVSVPASVFPPASESASPRGRHLASPSRWARVTCFLEQRGELRYVMVVRAPSAVTCGRPSRRDSPPQEGREGAEHTAAAPPPPPPMSPPQLRVDDESACRAQLSFCHLLLLSVAPTLNRILAQDPAYNAEGFFSPTDFALMRDALDAFEYSLSMCLGSVAVLPPWERTAEAALAAMASVDAPSLSSAMARLSAAGVDSLSVLHYMAFLLRRHCTTATAAAAAVRPFNGSGGPSASEESILFACLAYSSSLDGVGSGGAPTLLSCVDRSTHLFRVPLQSSDVVLLLFFAQKVLQQQRGEAWAPMALPGFSSDGYLWVHCCRVGGEEDAKGGEKGSPRGGLMLVQVSVSAQDFTPLSHAARSIAEALGSVTLTHFVEGAAVPSLTAQQQQLSSTPLLSLFTAPSPPHGASSPTLADPQSALSGGGAPAASSLLSFFKQKTQRRQQRRAALQRNALRTADALMFFSAVYRPAAALGNGGVKGGLGCMQHFRRCVTMLREGQAACGEAWGGVGVSCCHSLLAKARVQQQYAPGGGGPFTMLQLGGPTSGCYRVVLLRLPQSTPLLTQLCQFYYRSPDTLTEAEKQRLAFLAAEAGSEEAEAGETRMLPVGPRPYRFSQLLRAVQQSSLWELGLVLDAKATMEETWYCVMLVLHTLVL